MKILVTGGAGFIGSNFIRLALADPENEVTNLDILSYAGNLENLRDVAENPRYQFVRGDICSRDLVGKLIGDRTQKPDAVVNFAAESHVDRSIVDSSAFIRTNIQGTQVLLDAARKSGVDRFLQVSTDEVYGSLDATGKFTEQTPLAPNSPYSASKAGADLLVRSYVQTYGFPAMITRCSNNYGPFQFPEKLIPLMILNALDDKPLPVYGDGLYTRDWLHVEDHCLALLTVLQKGRPGAVYNIGGNREKKNIEIIRLILSLLGKPESLIKYVQDRPGHDRRYAIDASLIQQELGWAPKREFEEGIRTTVQWYKDNVDWVSNIKSGSYLAYYSEMYEKRADMISGLGLGGKSEA